MVECVLAKDETGVRFSLSAQRVSEIILEKPVFTRIFPSEHADISNIRSEELKNYCSRGEMDITAGFEPAVPGSSPGGSTKEVVLTLNLWIS